MRKQLDDEGDVLQGVLVVETPLVQVVFAVCLQQLHRPPVELNTLRLQTKRASATLKGRYCVLAMEVGQNALTIF